MFSWNNKAVYFLSWVDHLKLLSELPLGSVLTTNCNDRRVMMTAGDAIWVILHHVGAARSCENIAWGSQDSGGQLLLVGYTNICFHCSGATIMPYKKGVIWETLYFALGGNFGPELIVIYAQISLSAASRTVHGHLTKCPLCTAAPMYWGDKLV